MYIIMIITQNSILKNLKKKLFLNSIKYIFKNIFKI